MKPDSCCKPLLVPAYSDIRHIGCLLPVGIINQRDTMKMPASLHNEGEGGEEENENEDEESKMTYMKK